MGNDDANRKAWAEALRKRIGQLTNAGRDRDKRNSTDQSSVDDQNVKAPESPRHFVERRMRELDSQRERQPD
jgi:hypothetical protein